MKLTEDPEMGDIAKKLKTFFEEIEEFRRQAVYLPVNELIELVVTKTGYLEMVSAMPGGASRREDILMLMERAILLKSQVQYLHLAQSLIFTQASSSIRGRA